MIKGLNNQQGSALIMISVLIVIVGIFSLNINRVSVQTLKLQSTDRISKDQVQVQRYIRTVLSNEDVCTALVKVDQNNQVRIKEFEFRSGRVMAYGFQLLKPRYVFANIELADFTYNTRCPNMQPQKSSCSRPGVIPILFQRDKDGNLLKCQYGSGPLHCQSLGGEWVESAKTCDLCLGLGGRWKDGRCSFVHWKILPSPSFS